MCNGFADRCSSVDDDDSNYQCQCQHNTCGVRCDSCCPGFVQKKWRPRQGNDAFVCERKCHIDFDDGRVSESNRNGPEEFAD